MIHFIINILNKFYENTKLTDQVNTIFSTLLRRSNGKLETAVSNKKGNNDI